MTLRVIDRSVSIHSGTQRLLGVCLQHDSVAGRIALQFHRYIFGKVRKCNALKCQSVINDPHFNDQGMWSGLTRNIRAAPRDYRDTSTNITIPVKMANDGLNSAVC